MIVKIFASDGNDYYRIAFAVDYKGIYTRYLVLNKGLTALEWINGSIFVKNEKGNYRNIYTVVTVSGSVKGEWVAKPKKGLFFIKSNISGFDWFVENEVVMYAVKKGKPISDEKIFNRCMEMQKSLEINEWNELCDSSSIAALMDASWGFHDGYISEIEEKDGVTEILFEGCLDGNICLRAENACLSEDFKNFISDGYDFIASSSVFKENDRWVWVDDYRVKSLADIEKKVLKGKTVRYFTAKRICWKIVPFEAQEQMSVIPETNS